MPTSNSSLPLSGLVSGDRHLSLDALDVNSRKSARALSSLGVGAGSRVALLMRNDFAFFEATLGATWLGASTVPLNWHLTTSEMDYILRDCQAAALIAHDDLLSPAMMEVAVALGVPVVHVPTSVEVTQAYGLRSTSADLAHLDQVPEWNTWRDSFEPYAGAATPMVSPMFYTSGTTGMPKGVQRSAQVPPEVAKESQLRTMKAYGLTPDPQSEPPRSVMTGPLYHSAPNAYGLNVLRAGGLLILQARFDAAQLLEWIETYRITHLHMVPTMFSRLLALGKDLQSKHDLSSLKFVVHGAAPCPAPVKKGMIDWWGPVIHEYYAMTETGIIATSDSASWLKHPGTVGSAALGVSLRIEDDEGQVLPPMQAGEICIRSSTTDFVAYHGAEDKTRQLRRQGYLRTGDVGYLTEDGHLFISDRKSDMVISGGVNLYPAEVESVLSRMPGIADAAVLGIPDNDLGERLVAAIQRRDPALSAADIQAFLRQHLAAFKCPKDIRFDLDLPREDSGKIKKRAVKSQWLAQGASAP